MPKLLGRIDRPLLVGATVVLGLIGTLAAASSPDRLPGQFWILHTSYLALGLLGVVACRWRGVRSTGRHRLFWLYQAGAQTVWSITQTGFLLLSLTDSYSFPSLLDLFGVGSFVLTCLGLLVYPSERAGVRVRRLLDAMMTSLAIGLVMWQVWLGPVVAVADSDSVLRSVASLYFPISSAIMVIIGVLTLTRSPRGRRPLAVLVLGLTSFAVGGVIFFYVETSGVELLWLGFLFCVIGNGCYVLAPLLRPDTPDERDEEQTLLVAGFLPYLPVLLALLLGVYSYLAGTAGPIELWVALALVLVVLARQYVTLWQNVALTRKVELGTKELRYQAFHDALTGLANRALFRDRLEHALALHARDMRPASLVFLDLDNFKVVNDTLGHAAGDQLLIRVSERLRAVTRVGDTVARLGGDEFALLLEDDADAMTAAQRISDALRTPVELETGPVQVGGSIGVVELAAADVAVSPDELLARADTAMYQAKRSGKGRTVAHTAGMSLVEREDQRMRDVLAEAIADGSLTVGSRPIVAVATGQVVAVEAHARLRHDSLDIDPETLITTAARTGVLAELSDSIFRQAWAQLPAWSRQWSSQQTDRPVTLHIDVLASQVGSPELMRTITGLTGLQPGQLVLELAESALPVDPAEFRATAAELRGMGITVALDHFGVGHSSLDRLGEMDVDMVKVGRAVLDRIDTDRRQRAIMDGILHLARGLDIPTIADGIERTSQLRELERLGCPLAQGSLFDTPAPAAELTASRSPGGSVRRGHP